ncbi:hypothetical protein HDV00_001306 [Rhizophlyctis rosea]|nr:hypothetical protein HDV00_001306 [Rhizophlyctis rosea]
MMKAIVMSLALAAGVSAHGAVTSYSIGSTTYAGYQGFSPSPSYAGPQWSWPDYNPTQFSGGKDFTTYVRCNGEYKKASSYMTAAAGSQISAYWAQWTHNPATVAVYLYEVSSFDNPDVSGAGWFKIDEFVSSGSTLSPDTLWAGYKIIQTGKWTSTIPANLKPGNYVIRHELIARHQANTPQFYAECANIQITGSGSATPDSSYKVAIPGSGYAVASDGCPTGPPGAGNDLCFEVNGSTFATANYVNVGPKVWGGSGSGGSNNGGSNPTTTTTQAPRTTTTTRAQTTTTTTTSSGGNCAAKYGQCGGQGFSGPTCCQSGSTCKFSNNYYSQCL